MTKHVTPIENLDPAEIALLLHAGKLLLIDVREPEEYASERIPGALLYPLSYIRRRDTTRRWPATGGVSLWKW